MTTLRKLDIRKIVTFVDETRSDGGQVLTRPFKRSVAAAVFSNPFAEKRVEDLSVLIDYGEYLGALLTRTARDAMRTTPEHVESYGKGAIVGELGELEHGHALLHPKLGKTVREECGGTDVCPALIPSSTK